MEIPLATQLNKPLSSEGPAVLSSGALRLGVVGFVSQTAHEFQQEPEAIRRNIGTAAALTAKTECPPSERVRFLLAGKFMIGSGIAMHLLRKLVEPQVAEQAVEYAVEELADLSIARNPDFSQLARRNAEVGYQRAGIYHPLFTRWGPKIEDSRIDRDFIHMGFGFVFYGLDRSLKIYHNDFSAFREEVITSKRGQFDWDGWSAEVCLGDSAD